MNCRITSLRSTSSPILILLLLIAGSPSVSAANALETDRFRIHDAGQPREFEVAKNELHVTTRARKHLTQTFAAMPDAEAVRQRAVALSQSSGDEVELVLYEIGVAHDEYTRRILTKQVLVELQSAGDAAGLAVAVGAASHGSVAEAPGYFIFEAAEAGGALALAEALRTRFNVVSAEPLLAKRRMKRLIPNDTLFSNQWHLRNTGQNGGTAGIDINVTNVWNTYRGTGIGIAIIDDGLQHTHPDLQLNYDPTSSTNINDRIADPSPDLSFDYHGTACAGVAAARGNNALGVCSPAFEARLAGIRLLGGVFTDADEAVSANWRNDVLYLKSNSWGPSDNGATLEAPGTLMANALAQGALTGRGGKGTIYVWAGGNGLEFGDDANYDGYANSIYTVAVGAVTDQGNQADYSESGACLIIAAPSGGFGRQDITTTDLVGNNGYSFNDYTSTFTGTSEAAPLAAGVIALMLQANPNLGWRDVQEILMRSATKVRPADSDWIVNGAGFNFNHKFGAGLINAGAAIGLATNRINLGPQRTNSSIQNGLSIPIPDENPIGITRNFNIGASNRVEHVTVTVSITHTYRGDLAITLTSPNGTQSRLAEAHDDGNSNYSSWKFMSVRNWGENSAGTWTVKIADEVELDIGTLTAIRLDVYGTAPAPAMSADLALSMSAAPDPVLEGTPLTYNLAVVNNGPTNASAVMLTNSLPTNAAFVSAIASQGTATNVGNTVICAFGALASNATATVTIIVTPNQAGTVTNTAVVASTVTDSNSGNNTAAAVTTVNAATPQISNVSVVARPTSAIITWDTLSNATAQVEYGLTTNFSYSSAIDPTPKTNHSVLLLGLLPDTNYLFRVISRVGTNSIRSAVFSFSTDLNLIVDNPQARFSGNWTLGTSSPDKFGSSYQSAQTVVNPSPGAQATYTPTIPVAGKYDVYIWYPAGANRTTNAQVTILFDGGSAQQSVNQTINGGGWRLLGTNLDFVAGTEGFATIGNNTGESGKVVMADAMRWSYSPGQDSPLAGSTPVWWMDYYFGAPVDSSQDHDGDGYSTHDEYVLATDPTNAASRLEFRAEQSPSGIRISFNPLQGGRVYQLASATNLTGGTWTLLPDVPIANGANGSFILANTATPALQYYRLIVRLSP